ncbi:MAG: hypothetical protein V3S08_00295 [Phycisphaerales bacterium]
MPRNSLAPAVGLGCLAVQAVGQVPATMDHPTGMVEPYRFAGVAGEVVHVEQASWVRLYFDHVELTAGSYIRMTSALDGEVQELDAAGLGSWGNTSAYFNGDTVLVELFTADATAGDRVTVGAVARPAPAAVAGGAGDCGICDSDDRVPSAEPWAARLLPAGCTASVYNEASCMVSAGHCIQGAMVVQFKVPGSNGDCTINNPPVADQFPIVVSQSVNGGVGNDWAAMVPGPNGLGELPFERYGELRPIAGAVASSGATATVWGYGVDNTCTRSQTQQTDTGSIVGLDATTILWAVDIRGGNSGSAIIHDGAIVGIVTHCDTLGCPAGPNIGTRIDLPSFAAAREVMCGVDVDFAFPDGLPELVAAEGSTAIRVVVEAGTGTPVAGSGTIHVSVDGGPFVLEAMTEQAPNDYLGSMPASACGAVVEYYFTVDTISGPQITSPWEAPAERYHAVAGDELLTAFADDFETDLGWTVSGTATDGHWQRGVPIPVTTCDRGNPGTDGDGSGSCYLTDNSAASSCNSDVDAGDTILTSPVLDAGDPNMVLDYRRWFSTTAGSNAFQDTMLVEISFDGGATWATLETVGPAGPEVNGGWFHRSWPLVTPTSQLRVRFVASDTDPQSVVEAGVDGFALRSVTCGAPCVWDLDASGDVGINDFLDLLAVWGPNPGHSADFDGDGTVGISDFLELLANWGYCL